MGVPIPYSTSESIPLTQKWGQTFMHSLHLVQRDRNTDSSTAPGGLIYFLFRTGLFSVSTENSTIFLVISAKAVLKKPRLPISLSSEESCTLKNPSPPLRKAQACPERSRRSRPIPPLEGEGIIISPLHPLSKGGNLLL